MRTVTISIKNEDGAVLKLEEVIFEDNSFADTTYELALLGIKKRYLDLRYRDKIRAERRRQSDVEPE